MPCECADCTQRSVLERMARMTREEAFAEAWSRTARWQQDRQFSEETVQNFWAMAHPMTNRPRGV